MKWVLLCVLPAAAIGGMYLHAPAQTSSETYPRALDDVEHTLAVMSLPSYVDSTLGRLPSGNSTRSVVPGKSVTYYFRARGSDAGKFVVAFSAVDPTHTRVSTSMTMNEDAEALMKAQYVPLGKEFGVVGRAAMQEQVDARLGQRPFNAEIVKQAMANFAVNNMGDMMKHAGDAMDEAARLQEDRTYEPTLAAGEPMLEPTASR